jgi:carotenoid cleavage dioxygenase
MIHLEGNNAPVHDERDALPVRVVGTVPRDLVGTYYRNGPNPRSGWSPHLFLGDGMVHAVSLPGGQYRNRYVRTPLYEDAATPRDGCVVTTANTHVIHHEGHLLALDESGVPYELTLDTLDTVGPFTFDGALNGTMTAHPKRCPATGDLLFFGYSIVAPYLRYHRWSASDRKLTSLPIDLSACSMMHDFAITETHVVFFDSAFVFDGRTPWRWDANHGSRVGVMDRAGCDVRWIEAETSHLSHSANAYDDGDEIVLTGTRLAGPEDLPVMHEWRVSPGAGTLKERPIDDVSTEYPRVPDELVGRWNRFTYTTSFFYAAEPEHGEINKHDGDDRTTRRLPPGHTCGEPVFVSSARGREEDDGYLLTYVHNRSAGTSYLLILDAGSLDMAAEVHLPVRVPGGFHGSFVAAG